jgi:hypothetical protein
VVDLNCGLRHPPRRFPNLKQKSLRSGTRCVLSVQVRLYDFPRMYCCHFDSPLRILPTRSLRRLLCGFLCVEERPVGCLLREVLHHLPTLHSFACGFLG